MFGFGQGFDFVSLFADFVEILTQVFGMKGSQFSSRHFVLKGNQAGLPGFADEHDGLLAERFA